MTDRASAEGLPTDGLASLLQVVLRKYGGTMKGRGDHDIYDALVRYAAALRDHSDSATPDRADLPTEDEVFAVLSADNPRSRQHNEDDGRTRSMWRCIPIRDVVEMRARFLATPDRADPSDSGDIAQRLDEAHARGFREGYRTAAARATPDRADLVTDHHAADPHWHDPDGVTLHYLTEETYE